MISTNAVSFSIITSNILIPFDTYLDVKNVRSLQSLQSLHYLCKKTTFQIISVDFRLSAPRCRPPCTSEQSWAHQPPNMLLASCKAIQRLKVVTLSTCPSMISSQNFSDKKNFRHFKRKKTLAETIHYILKVLCHYAKETLFMDLLLNSHIEIMKIAFCHTDLLRFRFDCSLFQTFPRQLEDLWVRPWRTSETALCRAVRCWHHISSPGRLASSQANLRQELYMTRSRLNSGFCYTYIYIFLLIYNYIHIYIY